MGRNEKAEIRGMIFGVQRYSIHDGPGIRTALFLKGCNLHCSWCHNPEGICAKPQIAWNANRCTLCGMCASVCEQGVHVFTGVSGSSGNTEQSMEKGAAESAHTVHFARCTGCGQCVELCPGQALQLYGMPVSVSEARKRLLRDRKFYGEEGGVTLSGGEALLQLEFCAALLRALKEEGIHCALETHGVHPFSDYERVLDDVDLYLYDYKITDPAVYREHVGGGQARSLDNLCRLHDAGKKIILRCPIIPGINDHKAHFEEIAAITRRLPNLLGAELLPYHPLGISKSGRIGEAQQEYELPQAQTVKHWKEIVAGAGGRLWGSESIR